MLSEVVGMALLVAKSKVASAAAIKYALARHQNQRFVAATREIEIIESNKLVSA